MEDHVMKEASVIGLGTMGATLARLLLRSGYGVTVWNRTSTKADPLLREGAVLAPSAAAAAAASPAVVMCVYDYKAANEILGAQSFDGALSGRVLVHLTTGSPKEARDLERWTRKRSAEYLDGAIQAAPSQMGKPDTPILISGDEDAFRRSEPLLKVLGGNLTYLGADAGAASAMDAATLSYVYGAMLGFIHGARVCEVEGFRVDKYGDIVAAISPSFGEFFRHEGKVIQSGRLHGFRKPAQDLDRSHRAARGSRARERDQRRFSRFRLGPLPARGGRRPRRRGGRGAHQAAALSATSFASRGEWRRCRATSPSSGRSAR
jgi:3-hydroxyisobutyrate dehydrogenase-like beta-hydroxyacid dehydrogenase